MRLKLDENLPVALADALAGLGHDADTVHQERLAGKPDVLVWEAAQRERRFLITQDLDFSDIRRFLPGTHHGILVVRLAKPGRLALHQRVVDLFGTEDVGAWAGSFVVATDRKLRVRRRK